MKLHVPSRKAQKEYRYKEKNRDGFITVSYPVSQDVEQVSKVGYLGE